MNSVHKDSETDKLKEQILSVLWKYLNPDKCMVILFGSEALSLSTPRSDIDIAVDCTEKIEDKTFLEIQEALNTEVDTLRKIDLIEIPKASEDFLEFALKGAIIWHIGREYIRSKLK